MAADIKVKLMGGTRERINLYLIQYESPLLQHNVRNEHNIAITSLNYLISAVHDVTYFYT